MNHEQLSYLHAKSIHQSMLTITPRRDICIEKCHLRPLHELTLSTACVTSLVGISQDTSFDSVSAWRLIKYVVQHHCQPWTVLLSTPASDTPPEPLLPKSRIASNPIPFSPIYDAPHQTPMASWVI